jgi:hypothetical protein
MGREIVVSDWCLALSHHRYWSSFAKRKNEEEERLLVAALPPE